MARRNEGVASISETFRDAREGLLRWKRTDSRAYGHLGEVFEDGWDQKHYERCVEGLEEREVEFSNLGLGPLP